MRAALTCLVASSALVVGCDVDEGLSPNRRPPLEIAVDGSRLVYHDDGRFDLLRDDGSAVLVGAVGAVMLDATDSAGRRLSTDAARDRIAGELTETDDLGEAKRILVTVRGQASEPDLRWTLSGYPSRGFYTFRIGVDNHTGSTVSVAKAIALEVDAKGGGGLYLGHHPVSHRILENGSYSVLDFVAEVEPGDTRGNAAFSLIAPGHFPGRSVSNWNHAVVDLEGPSVWIGGALTFESSLPTFNLSYEPDAPVIAPDGRTGFSLFSAQAAYLPNPKQVAEGQTLSSELYYVHPTERDALAGLERYADVAASHLKVVPWTRRTGHRVPNGWNSWTGSGGTGGYGTKINEALILQNLDVMATELRAFGMDWFQVDEGTAPRRGDWSFDPARFPHGPAWLTSQIRARGLRPGLWMAPFTPDEASAVAKDHPTWFAQPTQIGTVISGGGPILDLTNPEVLAYLRDLFTVFRHDWGFDWLKLDFGYYALFGTGFYDPTRTREEAWRGALRTVRASLGDDAFFLLVGTVGVNYGIVDAGRTTLDNSPVWDWEPGVDSSDHIKQQGFKPTIRTAGRRWYLQDRLWLNHPDLILFRSNTLDATWPRITLEESRAFASFVGLSGGIVKLGDKLVDLEKDHLNTIRALLPVYGKAARPVDVFTREFPEVWRLTVDRPLDGYDESWELFGLFNWGFNMDMSVNPYTPIPDDGAPATRTVDLSALGLGGPWLAYEFWTQQFLGEVSGKLVMDVPSHAGRVVALRRKTGVPQFLGYNRHISMGATLMGPVRWEEQSRTLEVQSVVAAPTQKAPFTYEMAFFVPAGLQAKGVDIAGVDAQEVSWKQDGQVLRVKFVPHTTGTAALTLVF